MEEVKEINLQDINIGKLFSIELLSCSGNKIIDKRDFKKLKPFCNHHTKSYSKGRL